MERWTILYDRDCGFCRGSLGLILAWDRNERLRPVALQDPEAGELLSGMGEVQRVASWHLVSPRGEVHSAGAALAPLLRLLPRGARMARLGERFPGATERAYRWVAGHRGALGRPISKRALARADARIREREEGGG